jgi:Protein of unknown function (DUF2478)
MRKILGDEVLTYHVGTLRQVDAQCDFAAVVYRVKNNPARLLLDSTEDLRRSGVRTAGLTQLDSWTGQSEDGVVRTFVLSSREVIPVIHERSLGAPGCGLDCRKLASIAKMIEARSKKELILFAGTLLARPFRGGLGAARHRGLAFG